MARNNSLRGSIAQESDEYVYVTGNDRTLYAIVGNDGCYSSDGFLNIDNKCPYYRRQETVFPEVTDDMREFFRLAALNPDLAATDPNSIKMVRIKISVEDVTDELFGDLDRAQVEQAAAIAKLSPRDIRILGLESHAAMVKMFSEYDKKEFRDVCEQIEEKQHNLNLLEWVKSCIDE